MRRVGLLIFLLLLPVALWANSSNLVFQNSGGKVFVGAGSSLQLSNSTLTSFTGLNGGVINGTLGTVNFKTGAMTIGSLGASGTFLAGGSFTISGNGSNGMSSGVLFKGTFTGPVSWVGTFNPAGNNGLGAWTYVLSGTVSGMLSNGSPAQGGTVQFTFDVPKGQPFSKSVRLNQGITTVTVPEPGTLGLLGTGLLGLAGLVRRKLKN
jgi:PEP-CTERM motif-containing protein